MVITNSNSTSANPGAVETIVRQFHQEGLIAVDNNTLEMTNANVLFNVNVNENTNAIIKGPTLKIDFYGEYSIYNPNETIEVMVANPFIFDIRHEDLSFKVNGTPVSFYLEEYTLTFPRTGRFGRIILLKII